MAMKNKTSWWIQILSLPKKQSPSQSFNHKHSRFSCEEKYELQAPKCVIISVVHVCAVHIRVVVITYTITEHLAATSAKDEQTKCGIFLERIQTTNMQTVHQIQQNISLVQCVSDGKSEKSRNYILNFTHCLIDLSFYPRCLIDLSFYPRCLIEQSFYELLWKCKK